MATQKSTSANALLLLREQYSSHQSKVGTPVLWSIPLAIIIVGIGIWLAYSDYGKGPMPVLPLGIAVFGMFSPFIVGLVWSQTPEGRIKRNQTKMISETYRNEFYRFMQDYYRVDTNLLDEVPKVDYVYYERAVHGSEATSVARPNVLLAGRFKIDGTVLEGKFEKMGNDIVLMHEGKEILPSA